METSWNGENQWAGTIQGVSVFCSFRTSPPHMHLFFSTRRWCPFAMAAPDPRKRLQEEATCSFCLGYFADPVTLDCGHNFCRACIVQSWGESPTEAACPECKEGVQAKKLRPNRKLASMVEIAKELKPLKLDAAGWRVCERHLEPLKLFCQDDEAPICMVCNMSEHRAHRVVPMEEAVQEYKDQISHSLDILREKRDNILVYKAEKDSQDLLKQMEAEREKTAAAFRQVRQFLDEQEKLLLAQAEEVEKEIARRRDEYLVRPSGDLSSLDSLIRELEEKQQQSGNELLQNLGNILERYKKELLVNRMAFPAALKLQIHDFCDINALLEVTMKQFQDTLVSGLPLQKANVTLDPDTAHPHLILTENCKSARCADECRCRAVCNKPERFDAVEAVLGCEGFTEGRHFWEVTIGVGILESWAMGVARKSVQRKDEFTIRPEEGMWVLGKWGIMGYSGSAEGDSPYLSLSQEPQRIRVTLNCAGGRVSFFDADTGALLYVHSGASFDKETLLPFFYVTDENQLTLCP